jgi:hypothetical protein
MTDGNHEGLVLDWAPAGKQTATVTPCLDGQVVAVETLNLTKPNKRTNFTKRLCDGRRGIDPLTVEAELLKAAAALASGPQGSNPPDSGSLPEVDVSRIIRPERFIAPEVSGLAVPTTTTFGDRVTGRWLLYLRWPAGKRERRAFCGPGPRQYQTSPSPPTASSTTLAGSGTISRRPVIFTPDPVV